MSASSTHDPETVLDPEPPEPIRNYVYPPLWWGVTQFIIFYILLGLPFSAIIGTVNMLAGNAILRSAGHEGYGSNSYAAVVGVVGGTISILTIFFYDPLFDVIIELFIRLGIYTTKHHTTQKYLKCTFGCICFTICISTIGAGIMWQHRDAAQHTLGDPLSVSKAVVAGLVGATVCFPLMIPFIYTCGELVGGEPEQPIANEPPNSTSNP